MALFKFTQAILNCDPINVYNQGEMSRDFTYIDDLVNGLRLLMDVIPELGRKNFTKQELTIASRQLRRTECLILAIPDLKN